LGRSHYQEGRHADCRKEDCDRCRAMNWATTVDLRQHAELTCGEQPARGHCYGERSDAIEQL